MKVDYQKPATRTVYKFQPVHLRWSGLHVAISAMLFHIAANRLPDGKTPIDFVLLAVLGLAVFAVNAAGHLLDNKKPGQIAATKHAFTRKYKNNIVQLIAACLFVATILSFFLTATLWKFGLEIIFFAALCLWGSTKITTLSPLNAVKEPAKAILYTAGVWGSTWCTGGSVSRESVILGTVFFLIAFQIQLLFSHFEALDRSTTPNLARFLGKPHTRHVFYTITAFIFVACLFLCLKSEFRYAQRVSVVFTAMGLLQTFIFIKSGKPATFKNWWIAAEFSGIVPLLLL